MARLTLPAYDWKPRSYQLPAWRAMMDDEIKTIVLAWHRRCLAAGTTVVLADGSWERIENLQPGDKLLTWVDGEYVEDEVTDVFCTGEKAAVSAQSRGFLPLVCTADHEFLMNIKGRSHYFAQIGKAEPGRHATLYKGHNEGTLHNPKLGMFAGYMCSDGSINPDQQPKFTSTSQAMLSRVATLAQELFGLTPRWREKGNGWDIGLSNGRRGGGEIANPLKEWAKEQGCLLRKRDGRVPRFLWQADDATLAAFFSGVIDGDGSLEIQRPAKSTKPRVSLKIHVGESQGLALDYYYLLLKLGVRASSVKIRGDKCWTVFIGEHDQAQNLCAKLNLAHEEKAEVVEAACKLARRKPRAAEKNAYFAEVKTKPAGKAEMWDITTKFHRFIANGYVVHNCGKDEIAMHATAIKAMRRVANYYHCLPKYDQARKAIWEARNPHTGKIRWQEAFPDEMIKHVDNQSMMVTFKNNSTWQLIGSDNVDNLMSATPAGVVFSEAALGNPTAFGFFRPILLENNGWSMHVSSTRGKNHFYKLFKTLEHSPSAFTSHLSAKQTNVFTPVQLAEEKRFYISQWGRTIGLSLFDQEYLSDWNAATIGAVFGDELRDLEEDGRAMPLRYDRRFLVDTSWDLGVNDPTVILFWQTVGNAERLIDWYSATDKGLSHFAKVLLDKGYYYGEHLAPHDIDQREWGNDATSRIQAARKVGIRFKPTPRLPKEMSIAAASSLIDRMEINVGTEPDKEPTDDCEFILEALKAYRFKYDDKLKVMSKTPVHDWSSHYADALMTKAIHSAGAKAQRIPAEQEQALLAQADPYAAVRLSSLRRQSRQSTGAWG